MLVWECRPRRPEPMSPRHVFFSLLSVFFSFSFSSFQPPCALLETFSACRCINRAVFNLRARLACSVRPISGCPRTCGHKIARKGDSAENANQVFACCCCCPGSFLFEDNPELLGTARLREDFVRPASQKGQAEHLVLSSEPRKFNPRFGKGTLSEWDAQAACLFRGRPGRFDNMTAF